jgi:hydrogenase-4 component B
MALMIGLALIVLGGIASLALANRPRFGEPLMAVLVIVGLGTCAAIGVAVLWSGAPVGGAIGSTVPGGPWTILVDPLAGWFLVLVGIAGAAATSYGVSYLAPDRSHHSVAMAHALLALLLAAMVGVVISHSAVLFLVVWEVMAVSAYFLIMFEGDRSEARRAGLIYLVLTHAGTLALGAMFLLWGRQRPSLGFEELVAAAPGPWVAGLVLVLALVGFGLKAGIVPLHFWLPGAHAAAPSHVSALLSGAMLKMGVYGLLRVISLLGTPEAWFGWTLFAAGLASGVLGLVWAIGQRDLKRVLAYSSVENLGIVVLGIGVGALGLSYGQPLVATVGFTGAIVHSLNHALFKSLLFLGAGAMIRATGTRAIDRMGGLARRMPMTALAFAIGAVAIIGLPPLNGFIGEWVAAQGLLRAAQRPGLLGLAAIGLGGLGLIGGLALGCFGRITGSIFLGHPRAGRTTGGDERGLVAPMVALAALCLTAGVYPPLLVRPATTVAQTIIGEAGAAATASNPLHEALPTITVIVLLLIAVIGVIWYLRRRLGHGRAPVVDSTWGCGYTLATAKMQYTASSFGSPVLRAFGVAPRRLEFDRTPLAPPADPRDRVLDEWVLPLWHRVRAAAERLRPLQEGRITRYLQYMVLTVLLLLVALFAAVTGR